MPVIFCYGKLISTKYNKLDYFCQVVMDVWSWLQQSQEILVATKTSAT